MFLLWLAPPAACTKVRFRQRFPGVMRRRLRFPALSSLSGHIPAHEAKFLLLRPGLPQQPQQEAVLVRPLALQGLFQLRDLAPQLPLRPIGGLPGILSALDQGFEHRPARGAQNVPGPRGQLEVGVFQLLRKAACFLFHQLHPQPGQVAPLALPARRNEMSLLALTGSSHYRTNFPNNSPSGWFRGLRWWRRACAAG